MIFGDSLAALLVKYYVYYSSGLLNVDLPRIPSELRNA